MILSFLTILKSGKKRLNAPKINPVGRSLRIGPSTAVIVGVVTDVQISSGLNPAAPLQAEETVYVPASQATQPGYLSLFHSWYQPDWIVRTAGPVNGLNQQMQRALGSVAPSIPFSGFYTMSDLEAQSLATQRIQVALLGTMAWVALLLSVIGIFSLVASSVSQRTREFGVRIALGSPTSRVMALAANVGMLPAGIGVVLGLIGCMGALRVMRSALYGVLVYDALSILAVVLVLALATMFATTFPTLKIARTDPAATLREE